MFQTGICTADTWMVLGVIAHFSPSSTDACGLRSPYLRRDMSCGFAHFSPSRNPLHSRREMGENGIGIAPVWYRYHGKKQQRVPSFVSRAAHTFVAVCRANSPLFAFKHIPCDQGEKWVRRCMVNPRYIHSAAGHVARCIHPEVIRSPYPTDAIHTAFVVHALHPLLLSSGCNAPQAHTRPLTLLDNGACSQSGSRLPPFGSSNPLVIRGWRSQHTSTNASLACAVRLAARSTFPAASSTRVIPRHLSKPVRPSRSSRAATPTPTTRPTVHHKSVQQPPPAALEPRRILALEPNPHQHA
jgi:hypothetical protein